jgi:hypothetical protein
MRKAKERKAAQKNRLPKRVFCSHVVRCVWEKIITCTKCRKTFTVSGPYSGAKEVPQPVTCPFCGEPNEVKWPMDAGFTTIPKKPSASIPA